MHLLVIHSNKRVRDSLRKAFKQNCFVVETVPDCAKGSFAAAHSDYDIVIIEHAEPLNDAKSFCAAMRKRGDAVPVVALVSPESNAGVECLDAGADDFLKAPVSFKELVARVRTILRRPRYLQPDEVAVEGLVINFRAQRVSLNRKEVFVSPGEYTVLAYLAKRQGVVVSKSELIEHTFGEADNVRFAAALDSLLHRLRRKLKTASPLLETVSHRGYRFG